MILTLIANNFDIIVRRLHYGLVRKSKPGVSFCPTLELIDINKFHLYIHEFILYSMSSVFKLNLDGKKLVKVIT